MATCVARVRISCQPTSRTISDVMDAWALRTTKPRMTMATITSSSVKPPRRPLAAGRRPREGKGAHQNRLCQPVSV